MSIIWFVLAFAFSTSLSQDEPLDFSCATFHAFLSESELIARYGRENVMITKENRTTPNAVDIFMNKGCPSHGNPGSC